MQHLDLLAELATIGALKEGHFLLASGRHSDQYVEKFDLLRRPRSTEAVCQRIADSYRERGIDVVAGPTTGGVILAFETARQLGIDAAYAERRTDGQDGREFRRGTSFKPESRVLIVDDILTTGGSVRETILALREHPVEICGVAVLVDRSAGLSEIDGVPVTALARLDIQTWPADSCPLCKRGVPLTKPGTTSTG